MMDGAKREGSSCARQGRKSIRKVQLRRSAKTRSTQRRSKEGLGDDPVETKANIEWHPPGGDMAGLISDYYDDYRSTERR